MTEEILAAIGGTGIVGTVITYLALRARKVFLEAIKDLQKQVTPNGGNSIHDLARKALEVSVSNEARLKVVEQKVDALILSSVSQRG